MAGARAVPSIMPFSTMEGAYVGGIKAGDALIGKVVAGAAQQADGLEQVVGRHRHHGV